MATRNRVCTTHVENGVVTLTHYTDPADGPQREAGKVAFAMHDLATPTILDLAALGFASQVSVACANTQGHPNVPKAAQDLIGLMQSLDWHPGSRRTAVTAQPTDLQLAIAEAMNLPIDTVQKDFEERMVKLNNGTLYHDKAGKPRRFFSKDVCDKLAADPSIAPIMARLAQERARKLASEAKANKGASTLGAYFVAPSEAAQ